MSTIPLSALKPERTFILYYHFRAAKPLDLVFTFDGNLPEAIERGKKHCTVMNYRFIKVRPFIVDLDEREARRNVGSLHDDEIFL